MEKVAVPESPVWTILKTRTGQAPRSGPLFGKAPLREKPL